MATEKILDSSLRKKILWGLGVFIIISAIISSIQFFSIESQRKGGWDFYTKENSGLISDYATGVEIDKSGRVWIAASRGVSVYDGESWQTYSLDEAVRGMGVDPQGRVWALSPENIYIFDGAQDASPSKISFPSPESWGSFSIAFDSSGNPWIGTSTGIEIFDGKSWTTLDKSNSGLENETITAIAFDESGNAWIGTYEGITIYDGETWLFYNTGNSDIPGNVIQEIVFDPLGNAWIGTFEHGVSVFDGEAWETYNQEIYNSGYIHWVRGIAVDPGGHVLILHNFLTIFNGSDWMTYDVWNSGLANASGNDIAVDLDGRIWITSIYGVNVAAMDNQGLPEKVSQKRLTYYVGSFFNWSNFAAPAAILILLWTAVFLEDKALIFLSGIYGIVWALIKVLKVWPIDEFYSFLVVPALFGGALVGLVGSITWKVGKRKTKISWLTIIGAIVGTFFGLFAGFFIYMVLKVMYN